MSVLLDLGTPFDTHMQGSAIEAKRPSGSEPLDREGRYVIG